MNPYKVLYLDTSYEARKWHEPQARVDGYTTSNELQALINEQFAQGYEFVNITSCVGNKGKAGQTPIPITVGFMVTFKQIND